jgi:hypothetical protein
MFIVLGVLTVLLGVLTTIFMPDNPMSVGWLTEAEKKFAIQRIAINQTGIQNRHFKLSHLKELVLDLQIWLLILLTILVRVLSFLVHQKAAFTTIVFRSQSVPELSQLTPLRSSETSDIPLLKLPSLICQAGS